MLLTIYRIPVATGYFLKTRYTELLYVIFGQHYIILKFSGNKYGKNIYA
jgi:hypothetical protein